MWLREGDLPIVLRGSRNHGVAEGSAVFYRGLKIGEIVRTQLSRDSSKFEAWLRIPSAYRMLVHKDSHFVDSSGFRLDVGLGGMKIDLDSLQSVIAGSVQLFTPTSAGELAEPGREFILELDADPEYASWAPTSTIPATSRCISSRCRSAGQPCSRRHCHGSIPAPSD